MSAFLDTAFLLTFLDPADPNFAEASSLMRLARRRRFGRLFASDYVYDEAVTTALRRWGKRAAAEADAMFAEPGFVEMLRLTPAEFDEARLRFLARLDAGLSLTDWTIVVQCERRRVDTILSFDHGFDGFYARNAVPQR